MDAQPLLDRLVEIAPAYLPPPRAGRGYCVLAARIGVEVLCYFGVPALAMPCEAFAYNEAAAGASEAGETREGALVVARSMRPLAGARGTAGGWWGHMVVVLECEETMVDLDLRQFRQEAHGIFVPDAASFAWHGDSVHAYPLEAGGRIVYRPRPDDRSHRRGDWSAGRLTRAARPIIARVIHRVRQA